MTNEKKTDLVDDESKQKQIVRTRKFAEASPRISLSSPIVFLLGCISFTVGIGNIIKFPILVYKFNGGSFIVVYLICFIIFGAPVLYLELLLGQYHRSTITVIIRRMVPALQGIGWFAILSAAHTLYFYQYTVALILNVVLFLIMGPDMDFMKVCREKDKAVCYEFFGPTCNTADGFIKTAEKCGTHFESFKEESAELIFFNELLRKKAKNVTELGGYDYLTLLSVVICWLLTAMIFNRGVEKLGKFQIFPNALIFFILPALVFHCFQHTGGIEGALELLNFELKDLANLQIWKAAMSQVMFSLSIGIGGPLALASFSPPRANTYKIMLGVVVSDFVASMLSAVLVFGALGILAQYVGVPSVYQLPLRMDEISSTETIVPFFLKISSATNKLTLVLYFMVALMAGWSSILGMILAISASIADLKNISTKSFRFDWLCVQVTMGFAASSFVLGFEYLPNLLPMCGSIEFLLVAFTIVGESIVIYEFYTIESMIGDIHVMLGRPISRRFHPIGYVSPLFKYAWACSAGFTTFLILHELWSSFPLTGNVKEYPYLLEFFLLIWVFAILALIPAGYLYSHIVMARHFEDYIKDQIYKPKILWMKQKQLRSWKRLEAKMREDDAEKCNAVVAMLPDVEPYDLEMNWKLVYRQFFHSVEKELKVPRMERRERLVEKMVTGSRSKETDVQKPTTQQPEKQLSKKVEVDAEKKPKPVGKPVRKRMNSNEFHGNRDAPSMLGSKTGNPQSAETVLAQNRKTKSMEEKVSKLEKSKKSQKSFVLDKTMEEENNTRSVMGNTTVEPRKEMKLAETQEDPTGANEN